MRPTFPPKPPAPSIRQYIRPAVERSRELTKRLRPDQPPASRRELVEEIARQVPLPPTLLDVMREQAREEDDQPASGS